jgi:hypothetical protein
MRTFKVFSFINREYVDKTFFSLIGVKKYIENDLYFFDSNNYGVYEYVNNKIESYCSAKHIFNSENLNLTESIKDLV